MNSSRLQRVGKVSLVASAVGEMPSARTAIRWLWTFVTAWTTSAVPS